VKVTLDHYKNYNGPVWCNCTSRNSGSHSFSAEKNTLSKITIVLRCCRVKIIKALDKGAFTHAFPPLNRGLFSFMPVFRVMDKLTSSTKLVICISCDDVLSFSNC
jgi:hypothetical protein